MSFYLPSKYKSVEEAPRPTDEAITVHMMPTRTVAVRTFSWNLNDANCQSNKRALLADLAE